MEKTRVAILITCATVAACSASSVNTASFATTSEARTAGAVEKGWVPAALPSQAYELRAAYEPDGSRQWGLFNFRPDDRQAIEQMLAPAEVSVSGIEMDIPARIEWWPVQLRGRLDEERIRATNLRAYRSTDGTLTFLVNWNQGRAYYWRSPRR